MKIVTDKNLKHIAAYIGTFSFLAIGLILGITICGKGIIQTVTPAKAVIPTVIIDAGHGGPDGGTCGSDGTLEKDINLPIAKKLNEILSSLGVKTIMVRTEDISIHDESAKSIRQKKISDIHNRLKLIEETPNCIFVSIHQNHYAVEKYYGTQVFYSPGDACSEVLADNIQQTVASLIQPENTRVIKKCGTDIYLLYHAKVPAVMVECGFISNEQELMKLKTDAYQNKLAFSIAMGIINYINVTGEV